MRALGTDIIEIERITRLLSQERFRNRIYTPKEQAYLASRGHNAPQSAAGLFCAKEAVAKALGTGIAHGLGWQSIEITHTAAGAPQVTVTGLPTHGILLSISHCQTYATATALIWQD